MKKKQLEALKEVQKLITDNDELKIRIQELIDNEEKRLKRVSSKANKELHKKLSAEYYERHKEALKIKRRQRYIEKGY